MLEKWHKFFVHGSSRIFDEFFLKPRYRLTPDNRYDGSVLRLKDGINWRFSKNYSDSKVALAFKWAEYDFIRYNKTAFPKKYKFSDMTIEPWDRNVHTHIANIRIRKSDHSAITEEELNILLLVVAERTKNLKMVNMPLTHFSRSFSPVFSDSEVDKAYSLTTQELSDMTFITVEPLGRKRKTHGSAGFIIRKKDRSAFTEDEEKNVSSRLGKAMECWHNWIKSIRVDE
jgi:hypothetical protein